jgi:succinoglycan biosynthesis transport protein ExoP
MSASSRNNVVRSTYDSPYPSAQTTRAANLEINVAHVVEALRRRWLLPLFGCLAGLVIGAVFVALLPAYYKSSARIVLDKSTSRYLQANQISDEPVFNEMEIGSQVHVLSSESTVLPVIRAMNLARDAEFVGGLQTLHVEDKWGLGRLLGWESESAAQRAGSLERAAVEAFLKRLTVEREDVANVINVTFASRDSQKAANIVNALADSYLAGVANARRESNRIAAQFLRDRLASVKRELDAAEQAVREYKSAHNISSSASGTLYSAQMSNLNSRLLDARIAMVESGARPGKGEGPGSEAKRHAAVPDNDVIIRLRSQYLSLAVAASEIESRVGAEHGAVIRIRARMETVNAAIREERERIARSNPADQELARARYAELASTLAELNGEAAAVGQAEVVLRELESAAEALRSSYNGTLQKYTEVNKAQSQTASMQEARIITRAAPPLHRDLKKPLGALGGSIALGLLLGVGAALAKELAGNAFRTPGQVRDAIGVYCGIMPRVEASRGQIALPGQEAPRGEGGGMEEYVLDAPFSRFAESVRGIKVLVDAAHDANGDKVFCVMSSVANEGKTTVLTNLAAFMSASSAARLLVIDCDLHQRRLSKRLAPDASEGLIEALADPSRLGSLVCKRERSGLDVLPCALSTRIPNATELLGSAQMQELLDVAREAYDFVIIEVPPAMSVVDVKVIERFVDRFIFVVEWGKTNRRAVEETLAEMEAIRDRLMCVVLNKADPAALRRIEAYKGARFGDYYVG